LKIHRKKLLKEREENKPCSLEAMLLRLPKKNKKETGRRLIFSSLTLFLLHAGLLVIKTVTM
jgi:hypothetical protein